MKIDTTTRMFLFWLAQTKEREIQMCVTNVKAGHTSLKLCYFVLREIKGNRASKLKKGLFNVERVTKGIFWGETYFFNFYRVTHSIKIFPCSDHFSLMQHRLFLKLMS